MQLLKRKLNKKGAYGIDVVSNVMMSLFILVLLAVAVFAGISAINNSSIFTSGSAEKNDTAMITGNLTSATTSFFSNSGTFFSILAVVIIMIFLGLMIASVVMFSRGRKEGGL